MIITGKMPAGETAFGEFESKIVIGLLACVGTTRLSLRGGRAGLVLRTNAAAVDAATVCEAFTNAGCGEVRCG